MLPVNFYEDGICSYYLRTEAEDVTVLVTEENNSKGLVWLSKFC